MLTTIIIRLNFLQIFLVYSTYYYSGILRTTYYFDFVNITMTRFAFPESTLYNSDIIPTTYYFDSVHITMTFYAFTQ